MQEILERQEQDLRNRLRSSCYPMGDYEPKRMVLYSPKRHSQLMTSPRSLAPPEEPLKKHRRKSQSSYAASSGSKDAESHPTSTQDQDESDNSETDRRCNDDRRSIWPIAARLAAAACACHAHATPAFCRLHLLAFVNELPRHVMPTMPMQRQPFANCM